MPRYRLAQNFAFSDRSTTSTTHRVLLAETITSSQWNLLVLLLAVLVIASFASWPFLKFHRRKSRSRLRSNDNCVCGTSTSITNVQPEKPDASALWGNGEIPRTSIHYQSAERPRSRKSTVLITVMLLTLCSATWLISRLMSPTSAALEVFQVYQPVSVRDHNESPCNQEILLLDHVFGFSYGHPFVGYYEPPGCDFDTVRINLTVTSRGRQFDRLAHMYLGDVEVFRTSTAEPTTDGIIWSYIKDMSQYNVLWKERQKIIFELGNLINDVYTGSFNVTVMAHFSHEKNVETADVILPISSQNSARNSSSAFNVPSQEAKVSYRLDSRASRAIVSISACGQSTEEFWWSNVFSSDTETFDNGLGDLYGYSPFREIQLYIDGTLAGVVWPFPIIFTGGVSPGFWRPIVGTNAFDLRVPEIDISPFLPLLTDGFYHSFEIKVVGLDVSDNGTAMLSNTIGSYWVVSGNIFLYLPDGTDAQSPIYTGSGQEPEVIAPGPTFTITRHLERDYTGGNVSLAYSVLAERLITIKSTDFLWSQNLSFSNNGLFNQQGLSQKNLQHTSGTALSTRIGDDNHADELSFEYPLLVNTTYGDANGGLTIDAWIRRGLEINSSGMPGVSTYTLTSGPLHLRTTQRGQASYRSTAGSRTSASFGDTSDTFESKARGRVYRRSVRAVNGSIVSDTENYIKD
ncbi:peptide N-acetyl-beta-D-glucosaminyl asparaginase amidase A-domain-containing protein [Aspergillus varians]